MSMRRLVIGIRGRVQGVGFRPHVFSLAKTLNLTGFVRNCGTGVILEIQGKNVHAFLEALPHNLPPLARIDACDVTESACVTDEACFTILHSLQEQANTIIAPDTAPCDACLQELFDPESRYFQYPFLNCTHCGPRLTITADLPYDRAQTAMRHFPLCEACHTEYHHPENRRYHAQPIACEACGPELECDIEAIVSALKIGKIVALKGPGGYQLLCDARNASAVNTLRARKQREQKPFAVMVENIEAAACFAEVNVTAQALLESRARPIVLLKKRRPERLCASLAPHLSHLGIMLPATPLHHLLFKVMGMKNAALVVTSANISGNPLIIEDETAKGALSGIADIIISHNRDILTRVDDSVVTIINNAPVLIRRARGFVPERIALPMRIPGTLALGGHLKNTFCITRDDEAFVSQHIGSLTNRETIAFFHESIDYWKRLLNADIERVACDWHPDFYTSRLAQSFNLPVTPVQHHHAHLAAVAAEHGLNERTLGLALDGYGYGREGEAWGGELFNLEATRFERIGHFEPLMLPGGERAAREPWRMGAAVLHQLNLNARITTQFAHLPQAALLASHLKQATKMPRTSSCGRLFDAASALTGVCLMSQYEGQAAMQLESLVATPTVLPNGWCIKNNRFSMLEVFRELLHLNPVEGAGLFHGTLIAGLSEWLLMNAQKHQLNTILLSGGCFLNKVLTEGLYGRLTQSGLQVYLPERLPPNDGGLSLGQAFIAGAGNVSGHAGANH